ncbi:MAG TPA: methyltransferase domain-containing protein [Acidimicrobiales bacterium]
MVRYDNAYEPDSSYGSAVRLVEAAGVRAGVVLDLGCGYAAVAEPLEALGLTYLGVDMDTAAVESVGGRGLQAAVVDLGAAADDLQGELTRLLADRPLVAALALDSLEHLPRPEVVLEVLRGLAGDEASVSLVVSYPNVTHFDVAANLLSGRWYRTDEGLLDRTHLQFRDERGLTSMLAACGWREVATDDVVRDHSDQMLPSDSPFLRPGAPLRELLWGARGEASVGRTTFQFVRRYLPAVAVDDEVRIVPDEERELLAAIVVGSDTTSPEPLAATLADLAEQRLAVASIEVVGRNEIPAAVARQQTRWIVVLQAGTRLAADWSQVLTSIGHDHPGKVLRLGTLCFDDDVLATLQPAPLDLSVLVDPSVVAELDALDPVAGGPWAVVVADAYAVPLEVVATAGVGVGAPRPFGSEVVAWIARAAQVSGLVGTDIVGLAVPRSRIVDPEILAPLVAETLDERPMVLPAGSARRLAKLGRAARDNEGALEAALAAEARAEERATRLADQLRRLDHDLSVEREELARLRSEHARRISRRLLARLRRSR